MEDPLSPRASDLQPWLLRRVTRGPCNVLRSGSAGPTVSGPQEAGRQQILVFFKSAPVSSNVQPENPVHSKVGGRVPAVCCGTRPSAEVLCDWGFKVPGLSARLLTDEPFRVQELFPWASLGQYVDGNIQNTKYVLGPV